MIGCFTYLKYKFTNQIWLNWSFGTLVSFIHFGFSDTPWPKCCLHVFSGRSAFSNSNVTCEHGTAELKTRPYNACYKKYYPIGMEIQNNIGWPIQMGGILLNPPTCPTWCLFSSCFVFLPKLHLDWYFVLDWHFLFNYHTESVGSFLKIIYFPHKSKTV